MTNLCLPVDGSPVGPVALEQLVEDGAIHLAPCWRGIGHQGHRIAGVEQIEAAKTEERRSGFVVPHRRWVAPAVPVVGRVDLAMQVFEPSAGALGEHGVGVSGFHTVSFSFLVFLLATGKSPPALSAFQNRLRLSGSWFTLLLLHPVANGGDNDRTPPQTL